MSTPTPDTTTNYALPLPHPANEGADDCLRLRQAIQGVDAALKSVADYAETKADAADVESSIVTALEGVNAAIALKADTSTVNAALDMKVDAGTVDAALKLKADDATVSAGLAGKADVSALDLKADASTNTAAHETLATEIEAAKGKATWSGLTGKPSTFPPSAHKHPVGDVTGVLPIANGGTARTDGKSVALAAARTITLTGGVTGSVNFDGSDNVTLPTTLATGNASTAGGVKLSDATDSTSGAANGVAATPNAVKKALDLAGEGGKQYFLRAMSSVGTGWVKFASASTTKANTTLATTFCFFGSMVAGTQSEGAAIVSCHGRIGGDNLFSHLAEFECFCCDPAFTPSKLKMFVWSDGDTTTIELWCSFSGAYRGWVVKPLTVEIEGRNGYDTWNFYEFSGVPTTPLPTNAKHEYTCTIGHLTDAVNATSSVRGASATAVKTVYDVANTAQTTANTANVTANSAKSIADGRPMKPTGRSNFLHIRGYQSVTIPSGGTWACFMFVVRPGGYFNFEGGNPTIYSEIRPGGHIFDNAGNYLVVIAWRVA